MLAVSEWKHSCLYADAEDPVKAILCELGYF